MEEREKQELIERTLALDTEQARIIAGALPADILWEAIHNRLSELMDFRNKYEELLEVVKKIPY